MQIDLRWFLGSLILNLESSLNNKMANQVWLKIPKIRILVKINTNITNIDMGEFLGSLIPNLMSDFETKIMGWTWLKNAENGFSVKLMQMLRKLVSKDFWGHWFHLNVRFLRNKITCQILSKNVEKWYLGQNKSF